MWFLSWWMLSDCFAYWLDLVSLNQLLLQELLRPDGTVTISHQSKTNSWQQFSHCTTIICKCSFCFAASWKSSHRKLHIIYCNVTIYCTPLPVNTDILLLRDFNSGNDHFLKRKSSLDTYLCQCYCPVFVKSDVRPTGACLFVSAMQLLPHHRSYPAVSGTLCHCGHVGRNVRLASACVPSFCFHSEIIKLFLWGS